MAAYAAHPSVAHVEPIGIHTLRATPNDTYYDDPPAEFPYDQWHYWDSYGIDADLAWDVEPGDATVVVGVIDSGIKYDHGDLGGTNPPGPDDNSTNGNIWVNNQEIPGNGIDDDSNGYIDDVIGWDFVESTSQYTYTCVDLDCGGADNDPFDGNGHGTHVAGTIAAITNNGYAVAGIAGGYSDGTSSGTANGVKVVPCRAGWTIKYRNQETGILYMDYVAEAMYYMAELKIRGENVAAVNYSAGSSNSGGLEAAVDYMLAQDIMLMVAAGNSNSSTADYLGSRTDCMDVGATDQSGAGASFSNYGSWVDVAAPGVLIMSTTTDRTNPTADYIAPFDGTSMSCPHVVGVAALLESYNPSLSAQDKWDLIVNNVTAYNGTKDVGSGILNARLALDAAGPNNDPPVANFSGTPTSGTAPLAVAFADLSTGGPTSWAWTFGDGGTSTAQNPSHTYTAAGTYTVSLTATNTNGSDGETKTGYITVTQPNTDPPVADFSGTPTSGDAPLNVSFTDLSTNSPTSWAWTFGEGGTSTAQNPSHTYTSAGTFTVALTATNAYGSDSDTKTAYVTVTEAQVLAAHVGNIVVANISAGGPNRRGEATVTILDGAGQPVSGATVSGYFGAPTTVTKSGVTGANGVAVIVSDKDRTPPADWCFEVTGVTASGHTYNSAANVVTSACESGFVFSFEPAAPYALPNEFGLEQNYPNPFNPTTEIAFSLPSASHVTLEVFNIAGQRVAVLADGSFESGRHIVTWDASQQSSGMYLYRLTSGNSIETRKMILLK